MGEVLVVDDDADIRDVVDLKLQRLGHQVRTTGDPREALAMMAVESFDLVVLDWDMPHLTGGEVCARMRSMPHLGGVPVVIATAFCDGDASRAAFASGATAFLSKPFPLTALGALVTELLRQREAPATAPETAVPAMVACSERPDGSGGLVGGRGCRAGRPTRCLGPTGCAYVSWVRSQALAV